MQSTQMADQEFLRQKPGYATTAVHVAQDPEKWNSAAVVPPIVTSTMFKQDAPTEAGSTEGFKYSRSGNPTRNILEECLAALDGGKYGLTFASGLGATTTIVSLLSKGDHIISSDDIYGGTNRLFREVMVRFGIETTFLDFTKPELIEKSFRKTTKTLALRMEQHKKSSLLIAEWLLKQPQVVDVYHPGLPSHPQYNIARKQMSGHSGVFSFKHSGGLEESRTFLSSLKVFILAESLGGYESLAELPSLMTHASVPAAQRAELGITDSLLRLSVGLEDTDDLIADLKQALAVAFS